MTTPDNAQADITPLADERRFVWRDVVALLIVLIGGTIMLVWHVQGRGADMLVGYPIGVLVQLLFATLALTSASGVLGVAAGSMWSRVVRLAALFFVVDVSLLGFDLSTREGVAGIVVVYFVAALILLEFRIGHWLFVAAILLLLKLVGVQMAEATIHTWF